MNKKALIAIITVMVVLSLDQISKILVKTTMYEGEQIPVIGNWFIINFIENPGMAFGIEWGGVIGKYFLSGFRIVFSGFIVYYIYQLIQSNAKTGLIFCTSLILAGAVGNLIDCMFYGLIFTETIPYHNIVAKHVPFGMGYAPFLQGKVVDMLYFPLCEVDMPNWVPIWGGRHFTFFQYIFNIADSAITVGIVIIFIFQKRFFDEEVQVAAKTETPAIENEDTIQSTGV